MTVSDKQKEFMREQMFKAIRAEDIATMDVCLSKGADIQDKEPETGYTALYIPVRSWSSNKKDTSFIQELIARGAEVDVLADTNSGKTLMMYVYGRYGYNPLVELLLDKGALLDAKDKDGYTVFLRAFESGSFSAAKTFLDRGADLFAVTASNKDVFDLMRGTQDSSLRAKMEAFLMEHLPKDDSKTSLQAQFTNMASPQAIAVNAPLVLQPRHDSPVPKPPV